MKAKNSDVNPITKKTGGDEEVRYVGLPFVCMCGTERNLALSLSLSL